MEKTVHILIQWRIRT